VFGDLKFSFGASYIGRFNQLTQSTTEGVDRFLFSPELRTNVMYKIQKLDLTFSLFYKYTGEMPIVMLNENQELLTSVVDDFHTSDCSVSKLFWKKQLNATLGVKNIFNVTNILGANIGGAHSGNSGTRMVAMGRTYFFSLSYRFNQEIKK
jgi:outer membrane receptor for ferrienterochelin and colicins